MRRCPHCASPMHLRRGTWVHYGSFVACRKIQKLQEEVKKLRGAIAEHKKHLRNMWNDE